MPSEFSEGLMVDPLFVGATRPPMRWGVTYSALLFNMVFTIAQVSGTYGTAAAQTIVENCGNTLILRCSSGEHGGTSQFASKLIGEREIIRRQTSRGSDREGLFAVRNTRRSKNTSEQHVTEVAVMASQIEQLPDLCGYFKLASAREWRTVAICAPRRRGHQLS
jgi:predicted RNA-binding Zn-ribbon protein involved in translation (DUF1610 family)